jgi:hypothetical protein
MVYPEPMSETASRADLTVALGPETPAEPCGNCGVFRQTNRRLAVVEIGDEAAAPVAESAACVVCLEHYGADGVAVRLWPELCDWIPLRVFEECQCETCTGQIEFRFNAGTDFYE